MPVFTPGNTIRILGTFQNAGAYYDPTTVTIQVIGPNGSAIQTPSVVKDSTGNYHADVVANDPGTWQYRIAGTNPSSSFEGTFGVRESSFTA